MLKNKRKKENKTNKRSVQRWIPNKVIRNFGSMQHLNMRDSEWFWRTKNVRARERQRLLTAISVERKSEAISIPTSVFNWITQTHTNTNVTIIKLTTTLCSPQTHTQTQTKILWCETRWKILVRRNDCKDNSGGGGSSSNNTRQPSNQPTSA